MLFAESCHKNSQQPQNTRPVQLLMRARNIKLSNSEPWGKYPVIPSMRWYHAIEPCVASYLHGMDRIDSLIYLHMLSCNVCVLPPESSVSLKNYNSLHICPPDPWFSVSHTTNTLKLNWEDMAHFIRSYKKITGIKELQNICLKLYQSMNNFRQF